MAERLDHVYGARNRAAIPRSQGYRLKRMPQGTRPGHLREHTPGALGIDPRELSELLEACRSFRQA